MSLYYDVCRSKVQEMLEVRKMTCIRKIVILTLAGWLKWLVERLFPSSVMGERKHIKVRKESAHIVSTIPWSFSLVLSTFLSLLEECTSRLLIRAPLYFQP